MTTPRHRATIEQSTGAGSPARETPKPMSTTLVVLSVLAIVLGLAWYQRNITLDDHWINHPITEARRQLAVMTFTVKNE